MKGKNNTIKDDSKEIKIEKKETEFNEIQNNNINLELSNTGKKEKDEYKKRKIKWIVPIIIIIGIGLISTVFALININNSNIVSGVSIKGIDVSGLSKEEAKGKLETIINEKKSKDISIKYKEYESNISPTLLEVNYNIDKTIEEAYSIGRKDNIFVNNFNILFALIAKKDINIEIDINDEIITKSIEDISSKLPGAVVDSSYYIEEDNLIITKGKEGITIEKNKLIEKIKNMLNDFNHNEYFIEIPVINKVPDEINVDKIHEEIYKEAKDAYYTKEPFTIYPEVNGIDFDVNEAKNILSEEKEEYIIKLTITKPKVTIEQIGTEAFPDQLAIFTTRYDASNTGRTTNLRLACQKINGKVILPGETFSYNKILGERTIAAGYKEAKIYSNGEVVDGIGGGICQISSTLYNAVVMSNLEITERRNHQFVTSYVEAGRDATVVYGMTDFKFKNTRKYPIKLNASIKNGIATIAVYGIKEDTEYTISFSTRTIATIPYGTKYVEDSSIQVGTEKIKQKGANGIQTETYKITSLNGKVISRTLLSKDTYNPMQKIIIKGTKSNPVKKEETSNTQQTNTKPVEEQKDNEEKPKSNTNNTSNTSQNKTENNINNNINKN